MRGYTDHPACNSCGTQEPAADVRTCSHCPTLICLRCRANHEFVCADNQKRKRRGLGPTVRTPLDEQIAGVLNIPPALSPVDQGLAGVADLLNDK